MWDRVVLSANKYGRVSVQCKEPESSNCSPVLCPFHETCSSLVEDSFVLSLKQERGDNRIENKRVKRKKLGKTWK